MAVRMIAPSSAKATAVRGVMSRRSLRNRLVTARAQAPENKPEVEASSTPAVPISAPVAAAAVSFTDAMSFSGAVPEVVNGRLAMLGFFSALGAELASGETVSQQIADAPGPILLAFLAFAAASIVPILKGADLKKPFGPFTPAAEMVNGRAAMIGLVALFAVELFKGTALF